MHDERNNKKSVGPGQRLLLSAVVLLLLGVTQWFSPGHVDLWWQTFLQFLHAPLFGLIAVALLAMTPSAWLWRKRLLIALAATFFLSLVSEAAQIPLTNRNASLNDLVNDWLGALAFVAAAVAFSPSFHVPPGRGRYLVLLAVLLMIWPLRPLANVSAAYWERYQQLPSIAPLRSRASRMFYELNNAYVLFRADAEERLVSEIRFGNEGSSSIKFHDPWSDWRSYTTLLIDIEILDAEPLPLTIRVHDEAHLHGDQPHSDRFNQKLVLSVGKQTIRIPLAEIEAAPAGRDMDLNLIDGLVLFGTEKEAGRRFVLHDIRLE